MATPATVCSMVAVREREEWGKEQQRERRRGLGFHLIWQSLGEGKDVPMMRKRGRGRQLCHDRARPRGRWWRMVLLGGPPLLVVEREGKSGSGCHCRLGRPSKREEAGEEGGAPALGWASAWKEKKGGRVVSGPRKGVGPAGRLGGREGE
jgi:hypothetical protein